MRRHPTDTLLPQVMYAKPTARAGEALRHPGAAWCKSSILGNSLVDLQCAGHTSSQSNIMTNMQTRANIP